MVPKEQYGRAKGMVSFVQAGPGVIAPILAGALIPFIGLNGIIIIDVVTFVFAIAALLLVYVPPPTKTVEAQQGKGSFLVQVYFCTPQFVELCGIAFFANLFLGIPNSVTHGALQNRERQPDPGFGGNCECDFLDSGIGLDGGLGRAQTAHERSYF